MASVSYADSGLGWLADRRFFRATPSLISTINDRNFYTVEEGPAIFATVTMGLGNTGPVVISTVEKCASYSFGNTKSQGSFQYLGLTWYITQFNGFAVGAYPDSSGTSQKIITSSTDYEEIGKLILQSATVILDEQFPHTIRTIHYNGHSKVIKRICQLLRELARLGTTHDTAFYGDWGQVAYNHSQVTSGNPHNVSLSDLGLTGMTDKMEAVMMAVGATSLWDAHADDEYIIIDHDGDNIVFQTSADFLLWH